ncbi:hypothetical protein CSA56_00150 [candidate division KSB3 bacterium]|uniref:Restriction system protein Mrr-like N-terminal domain-containing protein n=1 Tax=candidate division KSB3 bacterium TaxID=2044937 RepID=A0A2G6KNX3_9BACT|nr:MAG: hypothetical protein CSA56_00150 [candidate division KSB3 bacterium]
MNISDEARAVLNKSGGSKIKNQVHWAHQYLVNYNVIDNSACGIWSLTPVSSLLSLEHPRTACGGEM